MHTEMTTRSRLIHAGVHGRSVRALVVATCAVLLTFGQARAGDTSIAASPSTRSCVLNEVVLIQVTIKNPTQASMPAMPKGRGYDIQYSGGSPTTSQRIFDFDGHMTQEVTYTYTFELTPLHAGNIKVGAFTWKDGGKIYKTAPFSLHVRNTGTQDPLFFTRIIARRNKVYVGEPLKLVFEIWIRKYRQRGLGPLSPGAMLRRTGGGATSLGIFSDIASSEPAAIDDADWPPEPPNHKGPPTPVRDRPRTRNGGDYDVFSWEMSYVPHKPGRLDVGDIRLTCSYPVRLSKGIFQIRDTAPPRRLRSTPKIPDIMVKAVPLAGRPADYNGAIGDFQLTTEATPTSVPVGDPITLTLNIKSKNAPLEGLSAPKLGAIPTLTRDFEVSSESLAGKVHGNRKVFSQTIRPLREDVKQIPPLPFSYFDPSRDQYETAWSDPIPLTVRPANRVAIAAADEHEESSHSMAPLVETTDGLQANHADIDKMLVDQSVKIGIGTYVFLGALPSLYLIGAIATRQVRKRNENADVRRRAGALRNARSRLGESQSPADLLAAMTGYVADRFNAPAGSVARRDAVDRLATNGASAERAAQFDALIDSLEAAKYAGATGLDMDRIRGEARELLAKLDSEVKP